jgi:ABC-type amino acid transport substrate-binding protein
MTTKVDNEFKVLKDYKFDISQIKEIFPILGVWLGKLLDNTAYIVAMLGLFIFIDLMLYFFGTINWTTFIALISAGSVGVIILTVIGIGMFIRIKPILDIVKKQFMKNPDKSQA